MEDALRLLSFFEGVKSLRGDVRGVMKLSVVRLDVITSTGRRPSPQTSEAITSSCCRTTCGDELSSSGRGVSSKGGGSNIVASVASAAPGGASDEAAPTCSGGSVTGAELGGCWAVADEVIVV